MLNKFQRYILHVFRIFYPMKVYGKENIPDGGAVVVCNHFSCLDCGHLASIYPSDFTILAKKELFKHKAVAKFIKWYGAIPIDRDNPELKSIIQCCKVLKDGHKLFIFPEGTRNKTGSTDLIELKGGSAVFAVKAKCPVVPIMFLKKNKIFTRVKIIVGKPFTLEEYYDKKLTPEVIAELDGIIRNKMMDAQAELKEICAKKKKK